MKALFQRFLLWVKSGADYWLVICPLLILIASVFVLQSYTWGLNVFRLIGIAFEIIGLMTVVISLSRECKKYDHLGYCLSFFKWVVSAKNILFPVTITGGADVTLGVTMCGTGRVTADLALNSIEEKVEYLLQVVKTLQDSIDSAKIRMEQIGEELSKEILGIQLALQLEITSLKGELKEKATLDYYLLISGALLTVIGMIMTNVPDDLFQAWLSFKKTSA